MHGRSQVSIQAQLMDDLKQALRDKDATRKSAIRMALAALKNARVAKNADLTDEDVVVVLSKEVKQRRDAMAEFDAAGRADLVASESAEIEILQAYLPRMLSEDEIVEMARKAIAETGASNPKEMGSVMRVMMARVRGRADGRQVSTIVRNLLVESAS
jgi:uncharacterized protein YqeY